MQQHQWLAILPAFAIAVLGWGFTILRLNRFNGIRNIPRTHVASLGCFIVGGYAAWLSELAILQRHMGVFQFCASLFRTVVNWFGFLLIFNENLYASRQQLISLVFVLIIAALWEVQHRIALQPD